MVPRAYQKKLAGYAPGKQLLSEVRMIFLILAGSSLTLEALSRGRGGGVKLTPLDFFGFKFLLLDRL